MCAEVGNLLGSYPLGVTDRLWEIEDIVAPLDWPIIADTKRVVLSVIGGIAIPLLYSVTVGPLTFYIKDGTLRQLAAYPIRWPILILFRLGFVPFESESDKEAVSELSLTAPLALGIRVLTQPLNRWAIFSRPLKRGLRGVDFLSKAPPSFVHH